MSKSIRNGRRKPREQASKPRIPTHGYYFIVTDTNETEQNYMYGIKDSIPKELQDRLVIRVKKTKTKKLVAEALELASLHPQYGEIWIVFDRDQIQDFDEIIDEAQRKKISVGWTNPCIEEWFSAYLGEMPTCSGSVDCCKQFEELFKKKTGQTYKKEDKKIYMKLLEYGDEGKAIAIARQKIGEHTRNGIIKPSQMCPATQLHNLVEEIKAKVECYKKGANAKR